MNIFNNGSDAARKVELWTKFFILQLVTLAEPTAGHISSAWSPNSWPPCMQLETQLKQKAVQMDNVENALIKTRKVLLQPTASNCRHPFVTRSDVNPCTKRCDTKVRTS
jgi:hypothetical protein